MPVTHMSHRCDTYVTHRSLACRSHVTRTDMGTSRDFGDLRLDRSSSYTVAGHIRVCCNVCCSVLQCVAVCCSLLQSVAVCCSDFDDLCSKHTSSYTVAVYVCVLQYMCVPPAPMNHVKYLRASPAEMPFKPGTPPIQIISARQISVRRKSGTLLD